MLRGAGLMAVRRRSHRHCIDPVVCAGAPGQIRDVKVSKGMTCKEVGLHIAAYIERRRVYGVGGPTPMDIESQAMDTSALHAQRQWGLEQNRWVHPDDCERGEEVDPEVSQVPTSWGEGFYTGGTRKDYLHGSGRSSWGTNREEGKREGSDERDKQGRRQFYGQCDHCGVGALAELVLEKRELLSDGQRKGNGWETHATPRTMRKKRPPYEDVNRVLGILAVPEPHPHPGDTHKPDAPNPFLTSTRCTNSPTTTTSSTRLAR